MATNQGSRAKPSFDAWPALPWDAWKDTCVTLHMWTQIVGKVKLRLSPFLNEWWHVALHPGARGLTTGLIPYPAGAFDATFDFIGQRLQLRTSDGAARDLRLEPRSVADFYQELMAALRDLNIEVTINTIPDEVAERIPFEQDREHTSYDSDYVQRWWRLVLQTANVLDQYRSPFVGKSSPVQFWWGGFDLAHTSFSGRPSNPPPRGSRMYRIAEDQENISCGLWMGAGRFAGPVFYSYTFPQPPGLQTAAVRPDPARHDPELGEFVLLYDEVRQAPHPEALLLAFFQSAYEAGASLADWPRERLESQVSK